MKAGRRNSKDGKRVLVYFDFAANDAGIRTEPAAPKVITQDDVGSRVRSVFVARVKEPPLRRLNA